MSTFYCLPCEIKEMIFNRLRYRDLSESALVAQDWWWLSVSNYKQILEEDHLIKSLIDFYWKETMDPEFKHWFNLIKYTNHRGVHFDGFPSEDVLHCFQQSRNHITSVEIDLRTGEEHLNGEAVKSFFIKLPQYFPSLDLLKLRHGILDGDVEMPKVASKVELIDMEMKNPNWEAMFLDPDSLTSLGIQLKRGIAFSLGFFKNLSTLELSFSTILLDGGQMQPILDSIRAHPALRTIKMYEVQVSREWNNVFPSTVSNIYLDYVRLKKDLFEEFKRIHGSDSLYERLVMAYVCQNYQKMTRFAIEGLHIEGSLIDDIINEDDNDDNDDEDEQDFDYFDNEYICKPGKMEEELALTVGHRTSHLRTLLTGSTLYSLTNLKLTLGREINGAHLEHCVPCTVKNLELHRLEIINFSLGFICEDPSKLEQLKIRSTLAGCPSVTGAGRLNLTFDEACFTDLNNLKVLDIVGISKEELLQILDSCPSLETLILPWPKSGFLREINPNLKFENIQELKLSASDASLMEIVTLFPNLQILRLENHGILLQSFPPEMSNLKLFSIFYSSHRTPEEVMDTHETPCKIFFWIEGSTWSCTYVYGQNDSIVKEVGNRKLAAYCKGLSTKYLLSQGATVFDNFKDFREYFTAKRPTRVRKRRSVALLS